jgi:RNA polymerase subunit RPABC4/transcription elongation factor Spt4
VTADFFGDLHDFFNSTTWDLVRTGLIALVALFWVATIFWVRKDARRRIADTKLVWLATLIGAIPPFIGPLIYMLFRPPEYLEDVRERELELKMIERGLEGRELTCWVCSARVEPEFLVCPVCTTRLRQACASCHKPLEPAWQVCPYCETPVVADENTVILRPPTARQSASRRSRQTRSSGS